MYHFSAQTAIYFVIECTEDNISVIWLAFICIYNGSVK